MLKLYEEGFLDGLRYAGHLLDDVPNEDLILNNEVKLAIRQGYVKSNQPKVRTSMHRFIRNLIIENNELKEQLTNRTPVEKSEMGTLT